VPWSIERSYFPSLVERGETFVGFVYEGYWIDIGTPEKYSQVHRDIMDGRFSAVPFVNASDSRTVVSPDVRLEEGATIEGPCFIDEGVLIKAGARVGPHSVIGRQTQIEEDASIRNSIIWPNCRVGGNAAIQDAILGRQCHVGRNVSVNGGAVLGDKTTLTDFSRA
jgi:NDP-sugar pyrophosphorylase family protein